MMMLAIQEVREKIRSKAELAMISIVEDDKEVQNAICNLLESAGVCVEAFESAEEFLESGPTDKKACLVLDVRLPRMTGLKLQRSLYGQGSSLAIIFVTGHADSTVREEALRAGAADFFYKPFNAEALVTSVHSALNRPQA
jgi:two-component system, LuxR family, response regulator FixJ